MQINLLSSVGQLDFRLSTPPYMYRVVLVFFLYIEAKHLNLDFPYRVCNVTVQFMQMYLFSSLKSRILEVTSSPVLQLLHLSWFDKYYVLHHSMIHTQTRYCIPIIRKTKTKTKKKCIVLAVLGAFHDRKVVSSSPAGVGVLRLWARGLFPSKKF